MDRAKNQLTFGVTTLVEPIGTVFGASSRILPGVA